MKHALAPLLALLLVGGEAAAVAPGAAPAQETPVQLRALSVKLEGKPLRPRLDAFQSNYQVLLPLGELSALLDLGLTLRPGGAGGTLAQTGQAFSLELGESTVRIGSREQSFEPRLVRQIDGELYVSTQLLARWLPLDLGVDLPRWQLNIAPRMPLRHAAVAAVLARQPAAPQAAAPVPRTAESLEANLLVMQVMLDGEVLSDSLAAYQEGNQVMVPLGEMARLLTLPIQVQALDGSATGLLLHPDKPFALNIGQSLVSIAGHEQQFDPRLATVVGDEVYVSAQLLSRWLPVELKTDMASLSIQVLPRERLPLQDRLERERLAALLRQNTANAAPQYPLQNSRPGLISWPMIDQSVGTDARRGPSGRQLRDVSTTYLTADLLGMEGSAYVQKASDVAKPELRLTLARNDPDAGLLGPAQARSVAIGSIVLPGVRNLMASSARGEGVQISNRPLDQPTTFDAHSLRGNLPPGWDVTLYYNDALVAYQASRPDGQYAFDDLPLSFGPNEFRLVFHGPLGQLRVERQSFLLDQSNLKPGQLFYSVAHQVDEHGDLRSLAQLDVGLSSQFSGTVGYVSRPSGINGPQRQYALLGVLAYVKSMILSARLSEMQGGGRLSELGLKTRVGGLAIDLRETQRQGMFDAEEFSTLAGGVRQQQSLSLNGNWRLPGLPVSFAMDALRNAFDSGPANYVVSVRGSTALRGTALSNSLRWQRLGDISTLDGVLQVSRRMAGVGLNGQLLYGLKPEARVQGVALSADYLLGGGYQINAGALHTLDSGLSVLSAGVSRNFGNFGLAMSGSYSNQHELAVGMQLFIALDRDPRTGSWNLDGQPLAAMGAVSARAFVDKNGNGVRDPGEELIPNAGFILNGGGRHQRLTDEDGTAMLSRLQPGRYTDIGLDPTTLEDPQWKPVGGVRVLPRPGRVEVVEFPVVPTSEIEGTVFLVESGGHRRGIGDARLELVDAKGRVVASTSSSGDGYYLFHHVEPGIHTLRVVPEQAQALGLSGSLTRAIEVPRDSDFISGQDLELRLASAR
ncbi:MAG: carboxypeptidase regulatory-like domain-containing protein [Paucibacter sp.]|nr:carboxypeptidase regulatory-like domain-containing protein [Roseateles sp.]